MYSDNVVELASQFMLPVQVTVPSNIIDGSANTGCTAHTDGSSAARIQPQQLNGAALIGYDTPRWLPNCGSTPVSGDVFWPHIDGIKIRDHCRYPNTALCHYYSTYTHTISCSTSNVLLRAASPAVLPGSFAQSPSSLGHCETAPLDVFTANNTASCGPQDPQDNPRHPQDNLRSTRRPLTAVGGGIRSPCGRSVGQTADDSGDRYSQSAARSSPQCSVVYSSSKPLLQSRALALGCSGLQQGQDQQQVAAEVTVLATSGGNSSPRNIVTSSSRVDGRKKPRQPRLREVVTCECPANSDMRDDGPVYLRLGSASTLNNLRNQLETQTDCAGVQLRFVKIRYTGKEGKTVEGCPMAKWIIRRGSSDERLLAVVKRRTGHQCSATWIVVALVQWDALDGDRADRLYRHLSTTLSQSATPTPRGCGLNRRRTCVCQGVEAGREGASFSFGCSYSMYYNGCKFARSTNPRRFRLTHRHKEGALEEELQQLATDLAPIYRKLAPIAYANQVASERDASACRLGSGEGRPWSGVTACLDFCAHAHKDTHNTLDGSTMILTLKRPASFEASGNTFNSTASVNYSNSTASVNTSNSTASVNSSISTASVNSSISTASVNSSISAASVNTSISAASVNTSNSTASVNSSNSTASVNSSISTASVNSSISTASVNSSNSTASVNSSISTASVNTSISAASVNSSISTASVNSSISAASVNSSISTASVNSSISTASVNSSISAASVNSSISAASVNSSISATSVNSSISAASVNSSISAASVNSSISAASVNSSISAASVNTSISAASVNSSISAASVNSSISTSDEFVFNEQSLVADGPKTDHPEEDEQLHVLPMYVLDATCSTEHVSEDLVTAVERLNRYPTQIRRREWPLPACKSRTPPIGVASNSPAVNRPMCHTPTDGSTCFSTVAVTDESEDNSAWLSELSRLSTRGASVSRLDADGARILRYHDDCGDCFSNPSLGGVGIALTHGSVLFECAAEEVHASTAPRRPNRTAPSRLALVFYQHRRLLLPKHGWIPPERRRANRKRRSADCCDDVKRDSQLITGSELTATTQTWSESVPGPVPCQPTGPYSSWKFGYLFAVAARSPHDFYIV